MSEIPIACSLSPDQMRDRLAIIDALVSDALLEQQQIEGGVRTRFRDAPGVARRIRELVAAEASCCAFLSFDVGRDDGALWVDITGAPEAGPAIEQFFAAARA
jgi:hypothetical protein